MRLIKGEKQEVAKVETCKHCFGVLAAGFPVMELQYGEPPAPVVDPETGNKVIFLSTMPRKAKVHVGCVNFFLQLEL